MMTDFSRINNHGVVPTLNRMQTWAIVDLQDKGPDVQIPMMMAVGQLAARVGAVLYHIDGISIMNQRLIESFGARNEGVPMTGPDEMVATRYEVEATFYELVRLQDKMTTFPSRVLGYKSEPYRMSKMMEKLERGQGLPSFYEEVKDDYLEYWRASGTRLRAYRNTSAHYHPQFEESYFNHESGRIHILVPDNPEVKSWSKFTYDQKLNGAELAERFALDLFALCEVSLRHLAKRVIKPDSEVWRAGNVLVADNHFAGGGLTIKLGGPKDTSKEVSPGEDDGNGS